VERRAPRGRCNPASDFDRGGGEALEARRHAVVARAARPQSKSWYLIDMDGERGYSHKSYIKIP